MTADLPAALALERFATVVRDCWCAVPSPGYLTRERCGDPATDDDGLCDYCRDDCQRRHRGELLATDEGRERGGRP